MAVTPHPQADPGPLMNAALSAFDADDLAALDDGLLAAYDEQERMPAISPPEPSDHSPQARRYRSQQKAGSTQLRRLGLHSLLAAGHLHDGVMHLGHDAFALLADAADRRRDRPQLSVKLRRLADAFEQQLREHLAHANIRPFGAGSLEADRYVSQLADAAKAHLAAGAEPATLKEQLVSRLSLLADQGYPDALSAAVMERIDDDLGAPVLLGGALQLVA